MDSKGKQVLMAAAVLVLSAAAWFWGTGLHPLWVLTWLAPLPVMLLAPRVPRWMVFAAAFAGFAIGGFNVWSYNKAVDVPLWLALVAVFVPALVFGGIVLLHRRFVLRGELVRAAFALPVLWTVLEYLVEVKSPHSTWGNLGYTQMNFLPVIQIASVTGIWAISFTVFLFAGTVAALVAPGARRRVRLVVVAGGFYLLVFGYGALRLVRTPSAPMVKVGLISDDVARPLFPDGEQTLALARLYAAQVPAMAAQGAQVIVLPEKIGRIEGDWLAQADDLFEQTARANHVTIFVSFEHRPNLHEARLYAPDGTLEGLYEKHHMLPAFEGYLLPGTKRLVVDRTSGKWGTAICKDMDFPMLSRQYGGDGIGMLLVPAWDFIRDGWLHSRMAILRGVESGFSIARAAKQGRLTVTDSRGRVLAEQSSGPQEGGTPFSVLVASVPVWHVGTFYDRTGNWFAWMCLILVVVLLWPAKL